MKIAFIFLVLIVLTRSIPLDQKIIHDDDNNSILPSLDNDNDNNNDNEEDHSPYSISELDEEGNNNECSTCLFFTRIITDIMEKNSTQEFVINEASKKCHDLPVKYVGFCDKVVHNIPLIIKFISQKETPSHICSQLHMCSDFTQEYIDHINCNICQNIVEEADYIQENNITGKQIRIFMDDHCKLINNQLQETCMNMVDNIYRDIINNISRNNNLNSICKDKFICV